MMGVRAHCPPKDRKGLTMAGKRSETTWEDVAEWLHNIEDEGLRPRVVLSREGPGRVRVSVTVAGVNAQGARCELFRRGEVVGSRDNSSVARAALRACAGVLADVERQKGPEAPEPGRWHQLPLPLD